MVLGINLWGYNATTNHIHSGEFFEFDDDYMVKWLEASVRYNRKAAYVGAGIRILYNKLQIWIMSLIAFLFKNQYISLNMITLSMLK